MIYRLAVSERSTGTLRPVGDMVCDIADNGLAKSQFRYNRAYLESADAFALDPVSLPLRPDSFTADHPGVFGVFDDSLPDDWGRRILVRKNNIPRHEHNLPTFLLALGNAGLGALCFTDASKKKQGAPPEDVSIRDLSSLLEAAKGFETGDMQDADLKLLFAAGSSPGGARPKALIFDEQVKTHYLAKFPSVKDLEDVVRIEAATMNLAAASGLTVPATRLVSCAGRAVLLVERFDILPGGGRRHMISFQTLLKVVGLFYDNIRYKDLLDILRKYSADPARDSECFFRQMVFNAVVGNTDDHLKNFWMVHDQEQGWRLSPAFDLIPDIRRIGEHVLRFEDGVYFPGRSKLETIGRKWGISNAESVVQMVFDAMAGWKEEFTATGVSEKDVSRFIEIDSHF